MIRTDERSGVVAVVPARVLNPGPGDDARLFDELIASGVGVMALPDAFGVAAEVVTTARDAVDYLGHGYRVVVLRDDDELWLPELRAELARWGKAAEELTLAPGIAATLADATPFLQRNAAGSRDLTGARLLALPGTTVWAGSSDPSAPVALLLHGYGGTEQDLLPYLDSLPAGFAVAAVRGPLPGPEGTAAWFPAGEPGTPLRTEADSAEGALVAWLDATLDGRVVIPIGFSQGAALALMLLRSRPGLVPAAVSIAGFTIPADRTGDDRLATLRPPVFAAWDPADPVVVPQALERTAAWLAAHTTATLHVQSGAVHQVDDEVMAAVGRFLAELSLPGR